jgi:hypothetical protein
MAFYLNNMTPEVKERLYNELMNILIKMEDRDTKGAMMQLEDLINKLKFDKI